MISDITDSRNQIYALKIWKFRIYTKFMELMNKFELSYELPDKSSYLVPELLPKEEPDDFEWDEKDELCFIILMITFCLLA